MPQKDDLWYQISLPEREELSGISVQRLFSRALTRFNVKFVVVLGEPSLIQTLEPEAPAMSQRIVLSVGELLYRLPQMYYLDWGDFCFCENEADCHNIIVEQDYEERIELSVFTARASEWGWMYFYVRDTQLLEALLLHYDEALCRQGKLDSFIYYY